MISTNVRPSSVIVPLDAVDPQTLNAGAASSGWLSASLYHKFAAIVALGAIAATGAPVVTAEQSAVVAGTDPKALKVNGAASVAYDDAADGSTHTVDIDPLDVENGFAFFRVTITNAVAVAALVSAVVVGVGPKYETGPSPSSV